VLAGMRFKCVTESRTIGKIPATLRTHLETSRAYLRARIHAEQRRRSTKRLCVEGYEFARHSLKKAESWSGFM